MRATVGILVAIPMAFIGFIAMSLAADSSESAAMNTSAGGDAWNATTAVVDGLGQAAGPGLVWMGIAAIILIACGLLYMAVPGGGR